jgi:hypothetical protein
VLPAARILGRGADDQPPPFCRQLRQWGLGCERLSPYDPLVAVERADFSRLMVEAGLPPSIWGGLNLALIYLWLPYGGRLDLEPLFGPDVEPAALCGGDEPSEAGNPWEGAKCFWYDVTGQEN